MRKVNPLYLVPPGPNISKYLAPQIIYFKLAEIFGPPELKFLNYLDPFEIFYPSLIFNVQRG